MAYSVLTEFTELNKPRSDMGGGYAAVDWCVCDKIVGYNSGGHYYLLNDGEHVMADLFDNVKKPELYFDGAVSCHHAALNYYLFYGQKYPYMDDMIAAVKQMGGSVTIVNRNITTKIVLNGAGDDLTVLDENDALGSLVMDFI